MEGKGGEELEYRGIIVRVENFDIYDFGEWVVIFGKNYVWEWLWGGLERKVND